MANVGGGGGGGGGGLEKTCTGKQISKLHILHVRYYLMCACPKLFIWRVPPSPLSMALMLLIIISFQL